MNNIFQYWDDIISSVSETELDLFNDGVSKLFCLKLWLTKKFIPNSIDTSGEIIPLLRRIPVEENRQKVINTMLKVLVEISRPLQGSEWTELFDMTIPDQLELEHVELITSFGSYLKYLFQIVTTTKLKNINIKDKIEIFIEDFLNKNRFTRKSR
jgi:hypothetical protein